MPAPDQPLGSFARNLTSQNGEDGILEEIFKRIGAENRWCLEVGAWDGEHLSNTCSFWRDRDWSAVLIECSEKSYAGLKTKTAKFPKVHPVHKMATAAGDGSLDAIMASVKAPKDIDLVSIDVDGNDWFLFESVKQFTPRVIIIEHNPSIPPEFEFVQKPDSRARFGASAGAMTALAVRKGYGLAAVTNCNCIFVRNDAFPKLGFAPLDVRAVFDRSGLVYLMSCYNGKVFLNGRPSHAPLSRSFGNWFRNFLSPADRAAWPEGTVPVICQKATKEEE